MPRSRSPSTGRPSRRSRSLASFDSLVAPLGLPGPSGARRYPLASSTSSAASLAAGFSSPLPAVPFFLSRLCSSLAAFAATRLLSDPVAAPPVAAAAALAAAAAATAAAAFQRSVPVRPSAAALAAGAPVAVQLAAWMGALAVLGALRALLLAAVAAVPVADVLRPRDGGASASSAAASSGGGGGGVTASITRGRRTVASVAVVVGLATLLTADMDSEGTAGGRRATMIGTARGGALSAAAGRRLARSRAAAGLGRISLAAVERVAAANGAEEGGGVAGKVRRSVMAPRWARHAAVRLKQRLAPDGVAVEGAGAPAGGASSGLPEGGGAGGPPLPVLDQVNVIAPADADAVDGGRDGRDAGLAAGVMHPPDLPPLAGVAEEPPRPGSDGQARRRLLSAADNNAIAEGRAGNGHSRSGSQPQPRQQSQTRQVAAAAANGPAGRRGGSGGSGGKGDAVAGGAGGKERSRRGTVAADGVAAAPPGVAGDGGVPAALPVDGVTLPVNGGALGTDGATLDVDRTGLLTRSAALAGEGATLGGDDPAVAAGNPQPPMVDSVRGGRESWVWRHALRTLTGTALVGLSCTWAANPAFVALAVELHSRRAARVAALYTAALLLALPAAAAGLRSGLSPLPPLSSAPLVVLAAIGGIVLPAAMEHRAADRAAEPAPGFSPAPSRHRSASRHRGASAVGGGGKRDAAGHWAAAGGSSGGAILGAFAGCSEGPAVGVVLFAVAATVAHFLVPGAEPGGAGGVSVAAVLAVAIGALVAPFFASLGGSSTDGGGVADGPGGSGSRGGSSRSGLPRALRQAALVRRQLRSAALFVSAARRQHAMWQALTFLGFQAALVVGEWTYAAVSESPGLLSASADTLLCCIGLAVSLHALRLRANGDDHLGDARVGGSSTGRGDDGGADGGIKGKGFASNDGDPRLDATDVPSSPTTPGGGSVSVASAAMVQEQSRPAPLAAFVNAILLLFGAVVAVAGAISRVVGPTGAVAGEGRIVAVSLLSAAGNGLGLFFMSSTKPKSGTSGGSGSGRIGSRYSDGVGGHAEDTSRLRASLSTASVVAAVTSTTAAALSAASGACGNDAVRSIAAQVWANTVTCGAAVVGCGLRWAAGLRGGEVAATAVAAVAITAAAGSLGVDAARRLCLGIPAADAAAIDTATAIVAALPSVGRVERASAWPLPGGGMAAVARLRVVVGADEAAVTADAVAAYMAAGVRREWVTVEVVGGA
ncbi:hypothetical protein MMPV_003290 [Pyropia vietnamensis]